MPIALLSRVGDCQRWWHVADRTPGTYGSCAAPTLLPCSLNARRAKGWSVWFLLQGCVWC